jgi:hypothetical protein
MNDSNLPHRPPAAVVMKPWWRHRTSAWYDVGWPVLTGTATALGLTGARVTLGTLQKRLRGIREQGVVDRRFAEIARSLEADTESAPPDSTGE